VKRLIDLLKVYANDDISIEDQLPIIELSLRAIMIDRSLVRVGDSPTTIFCIYFIYNFNYNTLISLILIIFDIMHLHLHCIVISEYDWCN